MAVASAAPSNGSAPLTVSFSSNGSSDPEGSPLVYLWDFGDGSSSTLANPSHTFSVAGVYNARLTVTDNVGASASTAVTISVNAAARLRSSEIVLTASLRKNIVTVNGRVVVVDQNGTPVPGAVVSVTWSIPGGKISTQTVTTNLNGLARFTIKGNRGTYTLTVNNITKSGYWFDSANSILSRTITK